eukprot:3889826-Rhodomonas_salina.1
MLWHADRKEWVHANDSRVTSAQSADAQEVIRQEGYLFFYRKVANYEARPMSGFRAWSPWGVTGWLQASGAET